MAFRLTEEEYAELMRRRCANTVASPMETKERPKRRKYGNQRTEIDGKKFDSKHEADVYQDLMLGRRAGELQVVLRQVSFDLPGGIRYIADFCTVDHEGRFEVLDAKSEATRKNRVYINKKKQMLTEWGIEIREV